MLTNYTIPALIENRIQPPIRKFTNQFGFPKDAISDILLPHWNLNIHPLFTACEPIICTEFATMRFVVEQIEHCLVTKIKAWPMSTEIPIQLHHPFRTRWYSVQRSTRDSIVAFSDGIASSIDSYVPSIGIEPMTYRLSTDCSNHWATKVLRSDWGIWTPNILITKQAFCHWTKSEL